MSINAGNDKKEGGYFPFETSGVEMLADPQAVCNSS